VKNKWFHDSKHCYSTHFGEQMVIFKIPSSHRSYGVASPSRVHKLQAPGHSGD